MARRVFVLGGVSALAGPLATEAQQKGKLWRIGYLHTGEPSLATSLSGLQNALKEAGYVDGRDYVVEPRYAHGQLERLADLATELIRAQVDLIVAVGQAIDAARQATRIVPIVMLFSGLDPVAAKRVESLARPGGNVTGIALLGSELTEKRLELLLQLTPKTKRVAYVYREAGVLTPESLARRLGVTLITLRVGGPDEVDRVLDALVREHVGAVVFGALGSLWPQFVEATERLRLPASYGARQVVEKGGLMSLSPDFVDVGRRAASFVDRILRGAKPGELPVEQSAKFELVLKTAKALGLTIPPSLLARADQIIE